MAEQIERGLPLSSARHLQRLVSPGDVTFVNLIVSRRTRTRHARLRRPLNARDSDKAYRLARAWTEAKRVYGDDETARSFLNRTNPLLNAQTPVRVALSNSAGLEAVENILGRLEHGSAA
ncbi:antitoxin Xre/MbcA/ParS toxin-binding domain-containing protein [Salinisphaera hydrothermalis]|uniref:antitoxin Xre/MbcA/ParS toxin-binding domain-containing protein n=1 Tax=Salinisphaera hydrothermalis TaxID=563188 RepID=UPI00333E807C